jgi:superfamily I DNA and RNA helicase
MIHFITIADQKLKKDVLSQAKATYPNSHLWRVQMPTAMTYALEYIDERYDAIVVDEAQDFADEFWFPLEYLLTDPTQGPFYIFFDAHQNLYNRSLNFPVIEAPFELNMNCRNTQEIHDFAYQNYIGPKVKPADLHGNNVAIIQEESGADQAKEIHKILVEMIARKGIKPEQIVILVGDSLTKKEKYEHISKLQLPFGNKWSVENGIKNSHVLIDTIKRFKGLESEIVIIWGLPSKSSGELTEVLYVGSSRAKSELIIIGNENELTSAFLLNKS